MFYNRGNDRPGLIRNGVDANWDEEFAVYRPLQGEGLVSLG
jgi:hypothetical protein